MDKEDSVPENGELLLHLSAWMLATYFTGYSVINKTSFTSNTVVFFSSQEFFRGSFQFHLPDTLLTLQRLGQLKCSAWKGFEKKRRNNKYVLKNPLWMLSPFSVTAQRSQLCAFRVSNAVDTLLHTLMFVYDTARGGEGYISFFLLLLSI